jgi:Mg2+ and Co2+ transporter CorA
VRTLTMLATYATGLVLVPGLVVALYGAQVRGLPGQGHVAGLAYLALACALTALVTIAAFARAAQLRPTRPRRG